MKRVLDDRELAEAAAVTPEQRAAARRTTRVVVKRLEQLLDELKAVVDKAEGTGG